MLLAAQRHGSGLYAVGARARPRAPCLTLLRHPTSLHQQPIATPLRAQATAEPSSAPNDNECGLVFIRSDNTKSPKYSMLSIESPAYRGLLKTVCWTLNGLGIRAVNCHYVRSSDDFATFHLQLTDLRSRKLSDAMVDDVAQRIQQLIMICQVPSHDQQDEWVLGNVEVSNLAHPQLTTILVRGEPDKPGYLLELSSVLNGIGTLLHEAVIQGDPEYEFKVAPAGHDFAGEGRLFRFLVADQDGQKLTPWRVASVLYTLDLVAGRGYMPLVPPNPAALAKVKLD